MTDTLHSWASDLNQLHSHVWQRLVRGVGDRHSPSRHPTLATVTPDGRPRARTVVLRKADPASGTLEIYTDLESAKVTELQATPFAALHVWDGSAHLQIRAEAEVTIASGNAANEIWMRVPERSRSSYGGEPAPGSLIDDSLAYARHANPDRFAVLQLHIVALDVLHLGKDHRRARFERALTWKGVWLSP